MLYSILRYTGSGNIKIIIHLNEEGERDWKINATNKDGNNFASDSYHSILLSLIIILKCPHLHENYKYNGEARLGQWVAVPTSSSRRDNLPHQKKPSSSANKLIISITDLCKNWDCTFNLEKNLIQFIALKRVFIPLN